MLTWPPTHHIRRSPRARHIRLSVTPVKGLEIVLPLNASVEEGMAFLHSKRRWVEKQLAVLEQVTTDKNNFPIDIQLASLNKTWPLRYHHIPSSKKIILKELGQRLIFSGPINELEPCVMLFNRWLRSLAQDTLPDWLTEVSREIQLPFNQVSIRSQKTLWGSCSREKNISLNDRLLFLPKELVRYVLIHELCHTIYMSHGKRFWQLVRRFDPNYQSNERSLRDVTTYIPSFLYR